MENKTNPEKSANAFNNVNGCFHFSVADMDMMPLLREDRDSVTLVKPKEKLEKNAVVLYQSDGGQRKLSRVVFVNGDTYVVCGDAARVNEYNIRDEQIIGVMDSFVRKGRKYSTDSKEYERYLKLLPAVRLIYRIYNSLRIRILNFIKYLTKK